MTNRFVVETLPGELCINCIDYDCMHRSSSDQYCSGHTVWLIRDTKTGKTLTRYREPLNDRLEEMNFLAECIEETSF